MLGKTRQVWVPELPRISKLYLDCVVYLYPDEVKAQEGSRAGGSGFLVHVPAKRLESKGIIFAVTNRHVIASGANTIWLNTKMGTIDTIDPDPRHWYCHPDGDDIAVTPIRVNNAEHLYNNLALDRDFLTKGLITEYNIGIGDETFVVGRFISHEGKQRNLPTARFGNIAQMPLEPIIDNGFAQESFLIEARSIGGYSGSPVFVYVDPLTARPEPNDELYPDDPSWVAKEPRKQGMAKLPPPGAFNLKGPWLLGIDWCHLNDWKPVCNARGKALGDPPESMQVGSNTGMMGVVPAWKIAEIFERGDMAEWLEEQEERYLKDNQPPKISLDVSPTRTAEKSAEKPSD
jgi:hypothetical protein